MRYPAISPDGQTIAFTYMGDLYRVAASGGVATALTSHSAQDFMPVWSHDGRQIAFASDRHGNFDLFVIPATGGEARRLTFHSAPEYPYAFTPDNRGLVFGAARMDVATNRLYPIGSQPELWQVAVAGGRPEQLLSSPAEDVSLSTDGRYILYQDNKGRENVWRKHHTSAITRDIWLYDRQANSHRQVTTFNGEDRNPVLADNDRAFYYLSEASGSFNVHRMNLDGTGAQQVTRFAGPPVRFLSRATNGTLAFGHDGQLYTMAEGGQPQRVPVTIAADAKANNQRVVTVSGGVGQLAVSPSGKEVAFIFRGDVFVTSVEGTSTKRVTTTPEAETGLSFSPDGKALL
jgi:Tol biopolymer transport system component